MTKAGLLAALTLSSVLAPGAAAQPGRGGFGPGRGNFPEVGDPLPDVTAFDDQGKPFNLKRLRCRHVVLVFGCLT